MRTELIWTHTAAAAILGLSFLSLAVGLMLVLTRRPDLRVRVLSWSIGAFLLACAAAQLAEAWTAWSPGTPLVPDGGIEAPAKVLAALAALPLLACLRRFLAAAAALPSPEDLRRLDRDLAARTRERDAAEAASAAKSAFLARVSHEIRTPLSSILGFTDLLLADPDRSPEDRRRLDIIQVSGFALLSLVDDVVDVSNIEAGKVALRSEPFDLHALVETSLAMVRPAAEAKALSLSVEIAPNVPARVRGDADRVRQILLNLLGNAVAFTAAGAVGVSLRCEEAVSRRGRVTLAVKDTGPGIPPERQATLLSQDGPDPPRVGSKGLGLAVCRRLVALMGGEIGFESHEGYGSTFWVRLDLEPVAPAPAAAPPEPEPFLAAPRILLVEDIPANQKLVRLILEEEGYAVDTASNGVEAVAMIRSAPYRLVLMDVQMPAMDGLTATRRIRQMGGPSGRIPIVAMTGHILPRHLEACREAGMDDVIAKPFKRAELTAVIAHWTLLEGERARPPGGAALASSAG
ncbi:response regulator [Methylobacterium sp. WSM2598]|uniref:response regulator n=1 Tax=Methylobacterium sp. WSM2598 TaxID=398261 RepID=UPI0003A52428|nr:response regulator [Methylobacterium sp. WSM2598]